MKITIPMLFLLFSSLAVAQVPRAQGYFVQGFGATSPYTFIGQTSGGGEAALFKGLGIGAELGAIYQLSADNTTIGQFSLGGNYHFTAGRKDTKWDPFVAAGYTGFFRSGYANGYHYGGGVAYWFHKNIAVRAEVRDLRFADGNEGYPTFRIGLSFR